MQLEDTELGDTELETEEMLCFSAYIQIEQELGLRWTDFTETLCKCLLLLPGGLGC